jgi:hypothetical protein
VLLHSLGLSVSVHLELTLNAEKTDRHFSPHPDDARYWELGFLNQNRHEEITSVLVSSG